MASTAGVSLICNRIDGTDEVRPTSDSPTVLNTPTLVVEFN